MNVSIIIPAYNVEQYIGRCVDSILMQTFPSWELFLIDDGSTDNTGKICDEYASRDCRIKVFHKENGGVSSARNLALTSCTGDWIIFVDGDDTIVPEMLSELSFYVAKNPNVELYSWGYNRIIEGASTMVCFIEKEETGRELYKFHFHEAVWAYAFKRSRLKEWCIEFPIGITHSEDQCFTCKYLMHNPLCYSINRPYYNYYYRSDSACGQHSTLRIIENNLKVAKDLAGYSIKASSIDKRLARSMVTQLFHNYIGYLLRLTDYDHKLAQHNYRLYYKEIAKIMPSFLSSIRYILCFFSIDSYLYLLKKK